MVSAKRNELIHRLLAHRCEICQTRKNLEVHHIRKLADLNKPGRREKPAWVRLMAMRRRKTLVICRPCHEHIHAGRATAPNRITGERCDGKLSRTVREEGDGKGPAPRAPRRRPTSLDGRGLETERNSVTAPTPDPTNLPKRDR